MAHDKQLIEVLIDTTEPKGYRSSLVTVSDPETGKSQSYMLSRGQSLDLVSALQEVVQAKAPMRRMCAIFSNGKTGFISMNDPEGIGAPAKVPANEARIKELLDLILKTGLDSLAQMLTDASKPAQDQSGGQPS